MPIVQGTAGRDSISRYRTAYSRIFAEADGAEEAVTALSKRRSAFATVRDRRYKHP